MVKKQARPKKKPIKARAPEVVMVFPSGGRVAKSSPSGLPEILHPVVVSPEVLQTAKPPTNRHSPLRRVDQQQKTEQLVQKLVERGYRSIHNDIELEDNGTSIEVRVDPVIRRKFGIRRTVKYMGVIRWAEDNPLVPPEKQKVHEIKKIHNGEVETLEWVNRMTENLRRRRFAAA